MADIHLCLAEERRLTSL